jgi:serine/threonine-protein kinase RsbW
MRAQDAGHIRLPSRAASLQDARRFVDEFADRAGFSPPTRNDISLAVTEAVSNAIRHGSPGGEADHVDLQVELAESELVVTVRDHGTFLSPPTPSLPDPTDYSDHGRGLYLMYELMDEVRIEQDGGTVVIMVKKR